MYSYKTKGVCSREIQFDVENDIIKEVRFIGGCMGNTQGVAAGIIYIYYKDVHTLTSGGF